MEPNKKQVVTDLDVRLAFGSRMRQLRVAKGLSQEELAFVADIDRTYVSGVERGRRNIALLNICRLAHALGVEANEMLVGVPTLPPAN